MSWIDTYERAGKVIFEVDSIVYANDILTQIEVSAYEATGKEVAGSLPSPILDLACGPGRHSAALKNRGHTVIGLDYSNSFLTIAKNRNIAVPFINGDGRALPFIDQSFGSVLICGNSFGYGSDEENERMLQEASRVLKHGGILVFDITDKQRFISNIKPYSRELIETSSFGTVVDERWRSWSEDDLRVHARKRHVSDTQGDLLDTNYVIRLYGEDEIRTVIEKYFPVVHISRMEEFVDTQAGLMNNRILIAAVK